MAAGSPLEDQARDPQTDQQTLYRLAADHPDLRPLIASNPNTYPALLEWMGGLGDPVINAALAAREAADASEDSAETDAKVDETVLMAPPVSPAGPPIYQPTSPGPAVQRNTVMPKGYSQGREPMFQQPPPVTASPIVPGFPATQSPFPTPAAEPRRNGGLIAAFVALVILAMVAAGVVIYIVMGGGSSGDPEPTAAPTASDTTATPEETTPTPSESPSETPTPEETKFPAPPGSVAATWFASPSGNIACQIGSDGVLCTVMENNYEAEGYADCDGGAVSLSVGASGAGLACSASPVRSTPDVLVYNTSSAVGDYACLSTQNGMTCWNTISGESFALARDGWVIGRDGAISENRFPWIQ